MHCRLSSGPLANLFRGENMLKADLKLKYSRYTIRQEPDPQCRGCKGSGELKNKSGDESPCLCVVLSEPHSDSKRELLRGIGRQARRIRKELE